MGAAGTDTAIETADIALMKDDLSKVDEAVHLGRQTLRIIQTNIIVIDLPAMKVINLFFLLIFGPVYVSAIAQQSSPGKEDNFAGVNARGDQGMGFSHEKTTHHFHLLADGGAIEIQSNEPTDAATQEVIRQHLAMIAVSFPKAILPFRCLSMLRYRRAWRP